MGLTHVTTTVRKLAGRGKGYEADFLVDTPIVFGPDESEPILGVLALEGLGISVDPKTRSLKRERARSLK
jgi:predicted aspartyl protease